MSKQRTRKVKLWASPEVAHSTFSGPRISVTVEGRMGSTRIVATGELSPYCAQRLILKLRKALHDIRADQLVQMDNTIKNAEGPV